MIKENQKHTKKLDDGDCSTASCSIFWAYGTVTIKGIRYDARKNKILRYVEGLSWGEWASFFDTRKARKLFIKNGSEGEAPNL